MANSGYPNSYYAATVNAHESYPSLEESIQADVCIVGAGYTGLSAALHLAQAGYQVVVLETHKIGWGASGRNGGQVAPGQRHSHEEMIHKVGLRDANTLWDLSVESVELVKNLIRKHNIHCDLKLGVMHVSSKLHHAQDIEYEQDYLKTKLNYSAVQLVNKSNLSSMLGTDQYYNGLLYTDAVHLHPLNFALGLANAAKDAGAKLFENSEVVKYRGGKDGLVQTEKGSVKSKYVLLACNGYLDELSSKSAKKIMPINNFIMATEPLSDDWCRRINNEDYAVADSQFIVNYFKLSGDNRLLWGGGETYTQSFPKDIASFVKPHMLKVYPELQDINVDYAWGGTLAITMNRMPHFDRLEENVFIAQGYSGHGVAMATLAGKLMADAIQGSAEKFDVFNRYPIPNFPGGTLFRWPGLVLGMMYYSLRDRFL